VAAGPVRQAERLVQERLRERRYPSHSPRYPMQRSRQLAARLVSPAQRLHPGLPVVPEQPLLNSLALLAWQGLWRSPLPQAELRPGWRWRLRLPSARSPRPAVSVSERVLPQAALEQGLEALALPWRIRAHLLLAQLRQKPGSLGPWEPPQTESAQAEPALELPRADRLGCSSRPCLSQLRAVPPARLAWQDWLSAAAPQVAGPQESWWFPTRPRVAAWCPRQRAIAAWRRGQSSKCWNRRSPRGRRRSEFRKK